jgi:OmpA-OmpF porin, OOP family
MTRSACRLMAVSVVSILALGAMAGANEQKEKPFTPPMERPSGVRSRSVSMPARGLFEGERLSAAARQRLTELVVDAVGLQIEVALIVPTGPWRIDGSGKDERDLTPVRLNAVRSFLAERGLDPKHIYVESRVDDSVREPRLDVQVLGRPRHD